MIFGTKINIRRTLILLGIFLIGIFIGEQLGHRGTWRTVEKTLNTKSVNEAINKPTQSTTTNNKVEIKDLKIKKSDSIKFQFDPITTQKPTQIITQDSCDYYHKLIQNLRPGQLSRLKNKSK